MRQSEAPTPPYRQRPDKKELFFHQKPNKGMACQCFVYTKGMQEPWFSPAAVTLDDKATSNNRFHWCLAPIYG